MSWSMGGGRGDWRQVGGTGEWKDTRGMVGLGNRLFISHGNGKLYEVDPSSGQHRQLGDSSGWKTRLMFALAGTLVLVEESGNMYAVNSNSGQYQQVGKDGDWKNITCGDWTKENIYVHSNQGSLWSYSTAGGGTWDQIGNSTGWKSKLIFAGRGLTTVEEDGTLYRVDRDSGASRSIGKTQYKVVCGIGKSGHVYAHFSDGGVWDLDLETGHWDAVSANKNWKSRIFVTCDDDLITLEQSGTLYHLAV